MWILSKKALTIVGIGVVMLGLAALAILAAPAVRGHAQTLRLEHQPFTQLSTRLLGGPEIGISVRDVESADVTREKLPAAAGAVVEEVRKDSPADKAGFKAGDVVVTFDGEKVRSAQHLTRLVEETPDGREVTSSVVRNGDRVDLKVTPQAAEPFGRMFEPLRNLDRNLSSNRYTLSVPSRPDLLSGRYIIRSPARLGVDVQDVSGQLGDYFGTKEGALVTSVDDNSTARAAGLKAGDVITKINGQAVRNAAELRSRLAEATGETTITIIRDRKEQTLKVKLEDARVTRRITRRTV